MGSEMCIRDRCRLRLPVGLHSGWCGSEGWCGGGGLDLGDHLVGDGDVLEAFGEGFDAVVAGAAFWVGCGWAFGDLEESFDFSQGLAFGGG